MNKATKARLKKAGFVETTVNEFLRLTPAEEALIEVRLALTKKFRETRVTKGLTQTQVTIDLLISSLFRLGLTQKDVARAIKGA
jgi:hypothetical protein